MKKVFLYSCLFLFCCLFLSCRSISFYQSGIEKLPRTVFFVFDDGPNVHEDTTARLLDVLKKHDVQSMFSLFGERAEAYPELVMRIHNEGHLIVNHGYSDKWVPGMGNSEFRNNLIMGDKAISLAMEQPLNPKLYQPHSGFFYPRHEKIIEEEGYALFNSSIRVYDAVKKEKDKSKIVNNVIKKAVKKNGGIILLHDSRDSLFNAERNLAKDPYGAYNRSWIPDAVEEIITSILDRGFIIGNPHDLFQKISVD